MRILIADDHPVVREGLKRVLSETPDLTVGGEATTLSEVLDLARHGEWDLVILDLAMPGRGGLEILTQLKQEHPTLPVLVLSMLPEEEFGLRALRAGASGYIPKGTAVDELTAAIRKVASGGAFVSAHLGERLAAEVRHDSDKLPHELLSDREYQIVSMIASGKRLTDIANELSLSVKTISSCRRRALRKLNLRNDAELIRYAIEKRLVT